MWASDVHGRCAACFGSAEALPRPDPRWRITAHCGTGFNNSYHTHSPSRRIRALAARERSSNPSDGRHSRKSGAPGRHSPTEESCRRANRGASGPKCATHRSRYRVIDGLPPSSSTECPGPSDPGLFVRGRTSAHGRPHGSRGALVDPTQNLLDLLPDTTSCHRGRRNLA